MIIEYNTLICEKCSFVIKNIEVIIAYKAFKEIDNTYPNNNDLDKNNQVKLYTNIFCSACGHKNYVGFIVEPKLILHKNITNTYARAGAHIKRKRGSDE